MYKVVINICYGGFGLSPKACDYLNEKYNLGIDREFGNIDESVLPRHDKRLVEVVELMGEDANGFCSSLTVKLIHSKLYKVCDYDGREWVETPDSQDWVIIEGA